MEVDVENMNKEFARVAEGRILSGDFAKEFSSLDKDSEDGTQQKLDELYATANKSELAVGEKRVRERLGLVTQ